MADNVIDINNLKRKRSAELFTSMAEILSEMERLHTPNGMARAVGRELFERLGCEDLNPSKEIQGYFLAIASMFAE